MEKAGEKGETPRNNDKLKKEPPEEREVNSKQNGSKNGTTKDKEKKKKRKGKLRDRRRAWGSLRMSKSEEGLAKWPQRLMIMSARGESGSAGLVGGGITPRVVPSKPFEKDKPNGENGRRRPRSLSSGSEPAGYPLQPLKEKKEKKKEKKGSKRGRDKEKEKDANAKEKEKEKEKESKKKQNAAAGGSLRGMGGWVGGEGRGRVGLFASDSNTYILRPYSETVSLREKTGDEEELLSMREYFARSRSGSLYELEPKKSTTTRYLDLSCLRVFEELSNGKGIPTYLPDEDSSGEVEKEKEEREEEEVCLTKLNNLPDELLVVILSHLSAKDLLSSIQLVNKRFCVLAEYKGFWRTLMRRDFHQDFLICQSILSKSKRKEGYTTSKEILYKNGFNSWKGFYETAFNFYGSTKIWRNSNHMYGQYMREYFNEAEGKVDEAKAIRDIFEKFTPEELRDICMDSKIVCIGNTDVGKGYFCLTYQNRKPSTDYHASHFNNYNENIMIHGQEVRLSLWNTSGHEHYPRLRTLNYPKSTCFMLLYSVVNEQSFRSVAETWTHELRLHCPGVPLLLVATKADLRRDENLFQNINDSDPDPSKKYIPPCISYRTGIEMAKKLKAAAFVEVSAVNNVNIQEAVREAVYLSIFYLAQEIKNRKKSKETSCLLQ